MLIKSTILVRQRLYYNKIKHFTRFSCAFDLDSIENSTVRNAAQSNKFNSRVLTLWRIK